MGVVSSELDVTMKVKLVATEQEVTATKTTGESRKNRTTNMVKKILILLCDCQSAPFCGQAVTSASG